MPLHPLAREFAGLAEVYERGRPEYPPPVAQRLMAELSLVAGAPVLDLAAGTGKLTRSLVAAGLDVTAVEPLEPLRVVLAGAVGADRVHEGLAERIPLADATFAAVTVADAFHWFDPAPSLAEIRRVLRPGGGLALISTIPRWHDAVWGVEFEALLTGRRTEHPYFDGAPWPETIAAAPGWTAPRSVTVTTNQPLGPQRIADYVRSMSWVAALDDPARDALLARIAALVAAETPDTLPVDAVMWLSARD